MNSKATIRDDGMSADDCMEHGLPSHGLGSIHNETDDSTKIDALSMSRSKSKLFSSMLVASCLVLAAVVAINSSRSAPGGDASQTLASSFFFSSSRRKLQSNKGLTVGVYYYPWYGNNFHNGDGYVRRDLDPPQQPELGEYDDTKPEVIGQHLSWSRQANVGLWVTSWWGPEEREDRTTKNVIMAHEELGDMKIALHYETLGRVRESEAFTTQRVASDVEYMCETYFGHNNYYRIDGRPVVFVYLTRYLNLIGKIEEVSAVMRSAANKCGESLYIVGDHAFRGAPEDDGNLFMPFQYLDAVTNYDLYGGMQAPTTYAGPTVVDNYYDEQMLWRERAAQHGCAYVSAAAPGYNDRGVRLAAGHQALSRRLTEDDAEGSLFEYALGRARDIVDESANNMLMINSFNEWHEDTQIEPVAVTVDGTNVPEDLTNGVTYYGYGEQYLDILGRETLGHVPPLFRSSNPFVSS